jgi:hypothetical protein
MMKAPRNTMVFDPRSSSQGRIPALRAPAKITSAATARPGIEKKDPTEMRSRPKSFRAAGQRWRRLRPL